MNRDIVRATRAEVADLAHAGLDWVTFAARTTDVIQRVVPFQRSCWHTVDPGTILFTGSLNRGISCSGSWLAEHEYVIDDVNKWSFLARSGRGAGATSVATHGDLTRSARHRSHAAYGIGDELRGAFVTDGIYWGAAGFLRDGAEPWFTEQEVQLLAALREVVSAGLRRAILAAVTEDVGQAPVGPGVVVFDAAGDAESISPAAEAWIEQLAESPPPAVPHESKVVQAVAAQARAVGPGEDPLGRGAQARVRTRSGAWLLLYGTRLSGVADGRTAVIIQPATPTEVAPLVALAYGLSDREAQVARLCMHGLSTKEMARSLHVSPYTVQDHLKSVFDKTGVRSRGELVGQIFLEHFVPRWEQHPGAPTGWSATGSTP